MPSKTGDIRRGAPDTAPAHANVRRSFKANRSARDDEREIGHPAHAHQSFAKRLRVNQEGEARGREKVRKSACVGAAPRLE